ncbi:uncharacterized protein LOC117167433 isoform X1 [Belonocnema kinseyi]|uniref:uncharacterized protein LOC117167433 isoform X1 n=1 Tax=Belonocnema kinseyi TaxID=2817044 RepID=UPI00143E0EBD|nr:uncharacterized protein LOC117167433 isoform X1 [Belonocnema kinseyi]XP_033208253.1 uncharacterized protein LOC117167433 isoform X1 [Belonocnema kinseyi]
MHSSRMRVASECSEKSFDDSADSQLLPKSKLMILSKDWASNSARYSHVQSLINCFEIAIRKPDSLTNFISEGFGGKASDVAIVEHFNYLTTLPRNAAVMADRGFKFLDQLSLHKIVLSFVLLVALLRKLTKEQVTETRRIASLRIHIERVIERFRYFVTFKPRARIPIEGLDLLDYAKNSMWPAKSTFMYIKIVKFLSKLLRTMLNKFSSDF